MVVAGTAAAEAEAAAGTVVAAARAVGAAVAAVEAPVAAGTVAVAAGLTAAEAGLVAAEVAEATEPGKAAAVVAATAGTDDVIPILPFYRYPIYRHPDDHKHNR